MVIYYLTKILYVMAFDALIKNVDFLSSLKESVF